jgi:hypothetical protein
VTDRQKRTSFFAAMLNRRLRGSCEFGDLLDQIVAITRVALA